MYYGLPIQGIEPWISRLEALRVIQLRYTGLYSPQLELNQRPKDIVIKLQSSALPLSYEKEGGHPPDPPIGVNECPPFGVI